MSKKVKKVKEWLNGSDHQFEIVEYYTEPPGQIKMAVRLSDKIPFLRFAPWDYGDDPYSAFYVIDFMPDMKTIHYQLHIQEKRLGGYCDINDVQLDKESGVKVICIGKKVK